MKRLVLCAVLLAGCTSSADGKAMSLAIVQLREQMAKLPTDSAGAAGRFIIVNGTPQLTRNVMLLDTRTGRTWIVCTAKNVGDTDTNWCAMGFTGDAVPPKP